MCDVLAQRVRTVARRPGWGAALLAALLVAQAAVLLMRPQEGLIDPIPVRASSYFSAAELDRARDFRRPQLVLGLGALAVEGAVLAWLVIHPPRRLQGGFRRPILAAAVTGAALSVSLTVAALPIGALSRERARDVGLVTQSWAGWAGDVGKNAAIGALLMGVAAALLVALMRRFPRGWWMPGSALVAVIGAGFVYAGPVVLDPLFNTFEPLPRGQTRDDVLQLARQAGLEVGDVYVVDASRRTTAANAYVTGLGHTKRVVLYDNLLKRFTRDETRLVVAHELGHVHSRDVPRGLLYVLLVAPAALFAAAQLTRRLAPDGGAVDARGRAGPAIVPALWLSIVLVATPVTWISNQLSRRVEARADAYALHLTGAPEAFISFEQRITLRNVSDPDPPSVPQALLGTHPTALQRIGMAEAYERRAR